MKWPHTISLWVWGDKKPVFDVPCLVSDYAIDKLLPPSEYRLTGRSQERLIAYRVRTPLWVYPFLQELSPVAFMPSENHRNPFGRDFSAGPIGESLFIADLSVNGGILDLFLESKVQNPVGSRSIGLGLFIPNRPIMPLPPRPVLLPDLRWYWVSRNNQVDPSDFGFDGFPLSTSVRTRVLFLFEDSRLNPVVDIEAQRDIPAYVKQRYNLPDNLDRGLKFSFHYQGVQYNLNPDGYDIRINHLSPDGQTVGVLGFDIYMLNGLASPGNSGGLMDESARRLRTYPGNGLTMTVWHGSSFGASLENTPYYNDNILSKWGDTTYRVSGENGNGT